MELGFIFAILILIMSVIVHEISHGYTALLFGDQTARAAGRLTLNPIPHIDLFGSIILPGILALTGSSFLIGWAKPVPYNPYNLRNQRWSEPLVAAAGPLANILIAAVFSILIRLESALGLSEAFVAISLLIVVINLVLAIINLIPVPPIDGSKIVKSLLPSHLSFKYQQFENMVYMLGPFGLILALLVLVFLFGGLISRALFALVHLFTGLSFPEIVSLLNMISF